MHTIIKQIVDTLLSLPESDQEVFAKWLLNELQEEIKSELGWQKRFEETADILEQLADKALKDFEMRKTEPLDSAL